MKKNENKNATKKLKNKNTIYDKNEKNVDNINDKRKKKNEKKIHLIRIFAFFIIGLLITIYIISAIVKLAKNPSNTVIVKEGKISQEESGIGYIIREENVVEGENYKNGMEQIVDEGKKVAKGESIFRYFSDGEEKLKEKIKALDLKIQQVIENSNDDLFSSDTKLLDSQINQKLSDINTLNSIQTIQETQKALSTYVTKKAKIAGELSPSGSYLKKLIDEKNNYESQLNSNSEYIKAPKSGIVSYRVDGLEEKLTSNDFSKYNEEFLSSLNLKTGQIVSTNTEKGKIVNNFECYIIFTSKTDEANSAEIGDKLQIGLPSGKNVNAKVEYVIKENGTENKSTIVLSFNEGIDELCCYRKITFDIIWWNSSGYKIPNSAIIKQNGLNYVIRNKNGYLDKILIKVKKKTDSYAIIGNYSTSEIKDLSIESGVSTSILIYDELILNPTENQIKSTK